MTKQNLKGACVAFQMEAILVILPDCFVNRSKQFGCPSGSVKSFCGTILTDRQLEQHASSAAYYWSETSCFCIPIIHRKVHCLDASVLILLHCTPLPYGLPSLLCWVLLVFRSFACVFMLLLISGQITWASTVFLCTHLFHEEFQLLRQNIALFCCVFPGSTRSALSSGMYVLTDTPSDLALC